MANKVDLDRQLSTLRPQAQNAILSRWAMRAWPILDVEFREPRTRTSVANKIVLPCARSAGFLWASNSYPSKSMITGKSEQPAFRFVDRLLSEIASTTAFCLVEAMEFQRTSKFKASDDPLSIESVPGLVAVAQDMRFATQLGLTFELMTQPLWGRIQPFTEFSSRLSSLNEKLHGLNGDWDVWTRWYDAVLEGKPTPGGEELDIFRVTLRSEEDWQKGAAYVNGLIKAKEKEIAERVMSDAEMYGATLPPIQPSQLYPPTVRLFPPVFSQPTQVFPPPLPLVEAADPLSSKEKEEEIAARKQDRVSDSSKSQTTAAELVSLASPQPVITVDGKLDVSPNAKFDVPVLGHDLPALPIRQQRVIGVILSDLPSQSPRHLKPPLEYYRDELEARGTQPILGILKDMADIIEAACAANDGEWLEAGLRKSFDIFIANHAVLMEHFPFDIEREQRYAEINVDEDAVVGAEFVKPFEEAEAMVRASNAVTADTVLVVERMREIAEITAYIPPAHRNFLDPKDIVPNYGDRLGNLPVSVSVKKTADPAGAWILGGV